MKGVLHRTARLAKPGGLPRAVLLHDAPNGCSLKVLLLRATLNRPPLAALLAVALVATSSSVAYAEPVGPAFSVPSESAGSGLAYGSDSDQPGWLSAGQGELDEGPEIYSSRLSPEGALLVGSLTNISVSDELSPPDDTPHDDPFAPGIGYNTKRNEFLVVWVEKWHVWGRVLRGNATPLGQPFEISTRECSDSCLEHYSPEVAYNPDRDEYVVVWAEDSEHAADHAQQVLLQRLDHSGMTLLPEDLRLSADLTAEQAAEEGFGCSSGGHPQVAYNHASGGYLVVWSPTFCRGPEQQVVAHLLDAEAGEVGDDLHPAGIDSAFAGRNSQPAVASNGSEYLVVWTNQYEIYGQRLSGSGTEVGTSDFRLSDTEPSPVFYLTTSSPVVASNPVSGQWLVAWWGADLIGGTLTEGIYGQHLAPNGSEIGTDDFFVSRADPFASALASSLDSDEFLLTWHANALGGGRRVQSTNCVLTQSCPGPTEPSGGPPTGSLPALRAIKAALKRSLGTAVHALKRLGMQGLSERRRFVIGSFRALTAGRVEVTLTARRASTAAAAEMRVAKGARSIPAAGTYTVRARLTKRAKRSLPDMRRSKFRLEIRFRDRAGRLATASRVFVVRR